MARAWDSGSKGLAAAAYALAWDPEEDPEEVLAGKSRKSLRPPREVDAPSSVTGSGALGRSCSDRSTLRSFSSESLEKLIPLCPGSGEGEDEDCGDCGDDVVVDVPVSDDDDLSHVSSSFLQSEFQMNSELFLARLSLNLLSPAGLLLPSSIFSSTPSLSLSNESSTLKYPSSLLFSFLDWLFSGRSFERPLLASPMLLPPLARARTLPRPPEAHLKREWPAIVTYCSPPLS